MASQFKNLDAEEREIYEEKAKADKVRYEREMANYSAPEDSDDDNKSSPKKKPKKDKNAPKKPRTAYTLFCNDKRDAIKEQNADITFSEVNKLLGEQWKAATLTEKEKYEAMAAEDKMRYEKEMKEYQTKKNSKESDDDSEDGLDKKEDVSDDDDDDDDSD